jgi:hypothetical protein
MAFNIPPTPEYDRDLAKLEKHYTKALKELTKLLANLDPADTLRAELYNSLFRQISFIITELNEQSQEWIETTLTEAYETSIANSLVTMGIAKDLVEAKGSQEFSLISRARVEAMIADTFRDVLKATTFMEDSLKDRLREIQAEVLRQNVALQRGTVTSAKDLKSRLIAEGFSPTLAEDKWKGIVDAGGKRWDLTTYTRMLARTKLQQAQLEGATQTALENDSDLAVISSHGARDACKNFEGLIISLSGRTRGYRTLAELRNSGLIFHPNCQHSVHPIGDIDAFPQKLKDKAKKAERSANTAMKDPKAIKREDNKRRYLEKKEKLQKAKDARRKNLETARQKKAELRNPLKYNWVEAKSIQEATKWAKLNLGIKDVDFKGFDLQFANDLNKHLEVLSKQYPEVTESIKFVGTAQERNRRYNKARQEAYYKQLLESDWGKNVLKRYGEERGLQIIKDQSKKARKASPVPANVWAQATNAGWKDLAGITYNDKWSKDYERFKRSVAYSVTTKFHPEGTESPLSVLTHEFGHMVDYFLEDRGLRHKYMDIVNDALKKDISWFRENLSEYASYNDREVIAEAFAEYKHNPNPRPFAMKLGKAIDSAMEEYRRRK